MQTPKYLLHIALLLLLLSSILVQYAISDYIYPQRSFTTSIYVNENSVELKNGIDLSRNDLRGIRIYRYGETQDDIELRNINFDECNLSGADFDETCFVNCSFRSANLHGIRSYGYFKDCDFTDTIITGFMGEQIGKTIIGISNEDIAKTRSFRLKELFLLCQPALT